MDTQGYKTKTNMLSDGQLLNNLGASESSVSPRDEFSLVAAPTQEFLLAAKTGFNAVKYAYTAAAPENNEGDQSEEEKRKKDKLDRQNMLRAFSTFDIGGIEMSMEQIVGTLGKMNEQYDAQIERNFKSIVVDENRIAIDPRTGKPFETVEAKMAYEEKNSICLEGPSLDETTLLEDGRRVLVDGYHIVEDLNSVIHEKKEMTSQHLEDSASNNFDPNQMSGDIQNDLAKVATDGTLQENVTVLDVLNNPTPAMQIQAGFSPVNFVTPTVTYDPQTPSFAP